MQLDESAHNRGVCVRVPWLDTTASYDVGWEGPVALAWTSMSSPLPPAGRRTARR